MYIQVIQCVGVPCILLTNHWPQKAVRKYLKFDRLTIKQGILHHLYINNDVEYHQSTLLIKYQAQVLQILQNGQGH